MREDKILRIIAGLFDNIDCDDLNYQETQIVNLLIQNGLLCVINNTLRVKY